MGTPHLPQMGVLKIISDMKASLTILIVLLSLIGSSCSDDNNLIDWTEETTIEIDSKIVPVKIFGDPDTVDGMLIKVVGTNEWIAYPTNFIENFNFEEGYSYLLKVEITHLANPPQDSYAIRCKLISEISKIKI